MEIFYRYRFSAPIGQGFGGQRIFADKQMRLVDILADMKAAAAENITKAHCHRFRTDQVTVHILEAKLLAEIEEGQGVAL